MTTKVKRRLTSILCADVKSYSRLMESDETRTIGTLRQYRAAMDALVERHEGRTINTWGDAVTGLERSGPTKPKGLYKYSTGFVLVEF